MWKKNLNNSKVYILNIFISYIEYTIAVAFQLIMSNLSLGFYSINGINFISAIPKRDCNNKTNHRSTYVGNWLASKYGTQPLKGHKNEIKSYKSVCTDSEEDDDWALKANLQEKNEAVTRYTGKYVNKICLFFLPNTCWQNQRHK